MAEKLSRRKISMVEDRLQMMHAAQHIFVRQGVAAARVAEITAAAGVAYGTFYNHFGSKEVLAAELIKRIMEESDQRFQEKIAIGVASPEEVLAELLELSVQEALTNPAWKWILTDSAISLLDISPGHLTYRIGKELIPADRRADPDYIACLYRFANAGFIEIVRGISDGTLGNKADLFTLEFALKLFGTSPKKAQQLSEKIWKGAHKKKYRSYIAKTTHCLECGFYMQLLPSIKS
jgi:AcrR family transcriptional regulator